MKGVNERAIAAAILSLFVIVSGIIVFIFYINIITFTIWVIISCILFIIILKVFSNDIEARYYHNKKIKKETKNKKSIVKLDLQYNQYKGVEKRYTRNYPGYLYTIIVLCIAAIVYFILIPEKNIHIYFIIIGLALLLFYQFYLLIFETVTIGPNGIGCKHWLNSYHLNWGDIKTVGFTVGFNGSPEIPFGNIYVTEKLIKEDIIGITKKDIKRGIVFFAYRPRIVHHFLAYYNGEIKNLVLVNSWIRYLNRLNNVQNKKIN